MVASFSSFCWRAALRLSRRRETRGGGFGGSGMMDGAGRKRAAVDEGIKAHGLWGESRNPPRGWTWVQVGARPRGAQGGRRRGLRREPALTPLLLAPEQQ